jgi:hypothetical protein
MNLVKEHISFERGLDPKEAMKTGLRAVDQKVIDAILEMPEVPQSFKIDIKYFPKTLTGRYIKILIPSYWLMRWVAAKDVRDAIKEKNIPNIKSVSVNKDYDVLIKLK